MILEIGGMYCSKYLQIHKLIQESILIVLNGCAKTKSLQVTFKTYARRPLMATMTYNHMDLDYRLYTWFLKQISPYHWKNIVKANPTFIETAQHLSSRNLPQKLATIHRHLIEYKSLAGIYWINGWTIDTMTNILKAP